MDTRVAVLSSLAAVSFLLPGASGQQPPGGNATRVGEQSSQGAVAALADYLSQPVERRDELDEQPFAQTSLTRDAARKALELLWTDHCAQIRATRAAEMNARELVDGELRMPFHYEVFGEKPPGGRSMFISMHGGGGAPRAVNDRQWENQKKLYRPDEGVYVAPRAPTDTWNLWHQEHIDRLFSRLIEDLIVFQDVDPDRVYLLGYSAGGDGVFQLAPRMADRFAAASMMAGHPNETSPLGLRNLPFTMHVGGNDSAYQRNELARQWEKQLGELHAADPQGYEHWVKIYADKPHWLDREDAAAIPWMAAHRRQNWPQRIVWKQDDVRHARFYWLAVDPAQIPDREEIIAVRDGHKFDVNANGVEQVTILLCDDMVDLDQHITVTSSGQTVFEGAVDRSIAVIADALRQRGDAKAVFSGRITVKLPKKNRMD
jgi:predicted esterase